MFLNQILYMCCAQYYSVRSADNGLLCNCVSPSLLGSSTPYWGRINSEKTWPTNGVLKFISLSPQWGRKLNCSKRLLGEKISVGAFSGLLACRVLYWQIIETASTAPFTRLTLSSFHRSKICHEWHLAIWKALHNHQVCVVYVARERLIMYACSLPGLFIRALMRNKKRKRDLKFRPDPGLMFYLERRGRVSGGVWEEKRVVREKRGVTNGIEAWCLHSRPHLSQD